MVVRTFAWPAGRFDIGSTLYPAAWLHGLPVRDNLVIQDNPAIVLRGISQKYLEKLHSVVWEQSYSWVSLMFKENMQLNFGCYHKSFSDRKCSDG